MPREHRYFVYLLASKRNGTIYTGFTNNLFGRTSKHKSGEGSVFTAKYGVYRLVWFEEHRYVNDAIRREKSIKRWRRNWKIELIEKDNPQWRDLFEDMR